MKHNAEEIGFYYEDGFWNLDKISVQDALKVILKHLDVKIVKCPSKIVVKKNKKSGK